MSKKQQKMLIRIISSAVLLVTAIFLPIEGALRLVIFLIPYAVIGWDVIWKAIRNIAHGQVFDENFLMAIATIGAFFIAEYPEAVLVMLFYQIGEWFQSYAVGKSRKSISELMDIRPDYANIEVDGNLSQVDPEGISIGEVIVIKPGEKIPLDGTVLEGKSSINTSALTGESVPRDVSIGDDVISGCINLSGLLRVKVNHTFGESTVVKILDLVENASNNKAKAENFITKFARYYTPVVVIGAALLAIIPPLFFGGQWRDWIERALTFLVISCPCALVISVPLSFFGGIGGASKLGILIKGGNYLEALANVSTVVFDKTGTLTKGTFTVNTIHPEKIEESKLLEYAALVESYSDHPIARALSEASGKPMDKNRISNYEEISGHGVKAIVDGKEIFAGNSKLMKLEGVTYKNCEKIGTIVHLSIDGEYAGHIVISDQVKPDSKLAIAKLKENGIRQTVMLTGDAKAVGEAVSKELGIDSVYTELLPADKVTIVEDLIGEKPVGSTLAFVGDGINDAPVLSRADIGIAMGGLGSAAAIEAADIVLMDDKPSKIASAIKISKRTLRIVRQNITFSLGIKVIVLVLGALGISSMLNAIFADVGVMLIAVINASRALNTKNIQ